MKDGLRYLYLHGFGSSRDSAKGVHFRQRFAQDGIDLELLDLNVPTFSTQTYSAVLEYLDGVDAETPRGRKLFIAGSSMGGYLAARWTELHPDRVAGLFALCPGFDLTSRWPILVGQDAFREWEETGHLAVGEGDEPKRDLHWEFVRDSRRHPDYPEVGCSCKIVHGIRDDVVPIEFSRRYAESRSHVQLAEVDDDHRLMSSLNRLTEELAGFLRTIPDDRAQ